jgi:hypothetical protein
MALLLESIFRLTVRFALSPSAMLVVFELKPNWAYGAVVRLPPPL